MSFKYSDCSLFNYFQRSTVLGNKIEMEITELVEKNTTLLRLGLHLEYNDCRHRVATHLQRNIDRSKYRVFMFFFNFRIYIKIDIYFFLLAFISNYIYYIFGAIY